MRRPDGTLWTVVPPVDLITTPDNFHIAIRTPNGILCLLYYQQRMIKFRTIGPENFEILPLTFEDIVNHNLH